MADLTVGRVPVMQDHYRFEEFTMKTMLTIAAALCLTAGLAVAQSSTHCYGWEDGGTSLGEFGNVEYFNDTAHVSEGMYSLAIAETGTGTGQIYVAWITGLMEGDVIEASFDVYDDSLVDGDSVYPRTRIWGHYSLADDIDAYDGSAGGNNDYSDGLGWNVLAHSWTIPAEKVALVIEARPYGADPFDQGYNWIDNICVTIPDHAYLHFPGEGPVSTSAANWSSVKALFQ